MRRLNDACIGQCEGCLPQLALHRYAAVLTTKREALSLYRDVWRASFLFVWTNEKGEEW
jgi:hypothetical protein